MIKNPDWHILYVFICSLSEWQQRANIPRINSTEWNWVTALYLSAICWFWSDQFRKRAGVKWSGPVPVHLAPGGAHRCAAMPTHPDRFAFVLWVSTFPRRTDSICFSCGGTLGVEVAMGKPQEMEMGRKELDAGSARCFPIPLVMKCHNTACVRTGARTVLFFPFWPICRFAAFDLRQGYICLLFFLPSSASFPSH